MIEKNEKWVVRCQPLPQKKEGIKVVNRSSAHHCHGVAELAFTMIELLAAICIISIFFALLSTGLKTARDKARQIECMSNLKQLYTAVLQYAQDNNDKILPYLTPEGYSWCAYLDGEYGPKIKYISQVSYSKIKRQIIHCPAEPVHTGTDRDGKPISWTPYCDYAMNRLVSWSVYSGWGLNDPPKRVFDFTDAARHFLFCDSNYYFTDTTGYISNIDYRHSGGINLVFLDGHCEWRMGPLSSNPDEYPW
ncbi:MAG: prepilin-type N-terminal cleavage/methylation domain-containing protein [Verrucomicrobiae bacterium]|nr:prepilin-type N-terminal cleavage/methylation domain-containing protein [Verrucomicrobiae bacterium]